MWIETLFFIVFGTQIFLMSHYYPKRILNRMNYIFKHYPIETHAKLYPDGYEKALKGKIIFSLINYAILALGIIGFIAAAIFIFEGEAKIQRFKGLPLVFGMVQAIPLLIMEISGFKAFKKMRTQNQDTKRSAELNPRGLLNFVSPIRLFMTISILLICVFVMLALNDFNIGEKQAILLGSMGLANTLFIVLGYILIHGKKLDPHQSAVDRHNATAVVIKSYTSISMLISVFFIFNLSVDEFSLQDWEPMFNSLYWLCVMFLSTGSVLKYMNVEDINYDVYKTTPVEPNN
ncbi:hypothetical protein [Paraglaciecola sp.]|uniref:hypothetical protein n=1 Tax=Paraglaciecola sp. TaxID=1920173 RepID=UPI003EFB1CF6